MEPRKALQSCGAGHLWDNTLLSPQKLACEKILRCDIVREQFILFSCTPRHAFCEVKV